MPQAAAHILIPLIFISLFRDYLIRKNKKWKKQFPFHYVLIAGISGVIPDIDVLAFWVLNFFGFSYQEVHRTFMHTIFIPFIFLFIGILFIKSNHLIGKHKLKLSVIFFIISLGCFSHLILDSIFQGYIMPLYPFLDYSIGLSLFSYLPKPLEIIAAPSLDSGLIIIWLIYMELQHKISDLI
ncbi:MAG: metal-dependent hydrolase [Candidatus Pacearchaeota archaeon]|jgi:membrane-bound metal-dependent hydrolase YbcI (DUF457 family)